MFGSLSVVKYMFLSPADIQTQLYVQIITSEITIIRDVNAWCARRKFATGE